jgi:hypothetical protein
LSSTTLTPDSPEAMKTDHKIWRFDSDQDRRKRREVIPIPASGPNCVGLMSAFDPKRTFGPRKLERSRFCKHQFVVNSVEGQNGLERILAPSGESHEQAFLYDAFISYRHVERDRKWAEWLIDALERYRVPKALQDKGVPPRLRKVFRDEDEVPASADLNAQIEDALRASRFLIVVCSPYTPRSKWVAREIEIFNELGRGDNVLALLTEGEPGDSFPTAMLERHRETVGPDGGTHVVKEDKEPLAADVRPSRRESMERLKRFAVLRFVACILGVKFDDLRRRDQERERKRRLTWVAVAATLCLAIAGSAAAYWQMMQPNGAYYRQIVWRWGVPEGLGPIDEETRSHRFLNFLVITQRAGIMQAARVVEVRCENSAGRLSAGRSLRTNEEGHARWVLSYRDDGSVERI